MQTHQSPAVASNLRGGGAEGGWGRGGPGQSQKCISNFFWHEAFLGLY